MADELHKKRAVALRYSMEQEAAPRIIAKGKGLLAERILELAKEHGLHIHEDPDLVSILSKLDVDMEIPGELYHAVAEILVFVYQLNQKMGKK